MNMRHTGKKLKVENEQYCKLRYKVNVAANKIVNKCSKKRIVK